MLFAETTRGWTRKYYSIKNKLILPIVAADFQIVAAGAGSFESAAVLIQDFEQYSWPAESQPDRRIEHFAGCVADSAASGRAAFATVDFGWNSLSLAGKVTI